MEVPATVHGAWRPLIGLASFAVVTAALSLARAVLIPVALAILLTILLGPLVRILERLRIPRVPAVFMVVVLSFGLMGGIGWGVAIQARWREA